MTETKSLCLRNPAQPARYVRPAIVEPLNLTVAAATRALGITRVALSRFLNGQAALAPGMAIRLDKAFGADMATLMRMQGSYDIAQAGRRQGGISVARYEAEGSDPQHGFQ